MAALQSIDNFFKISESKSSFKQEIRVLLHDAGADTRIRQNKYLNNKFPARRMLASYLMSPKFNHSRDKPMTRSCSLSSQWLCVIIACVTSLALFYDANLIAGPVQEPGSYPAAVMNSAGDFILTGNWKTLASWQGRYSALPMKTGASATDIFTAAIADRNAIAEYYGIACSGREIFLYSPRRSSRFPGGSWHPVATADSSTSLSPPGGRWRCAMLSTGQWAALDLVEKSLWLYSGKKTPLPGLGEEALLAGLDHHFVVIDNKSNLFLINKTSEVIKQVSVFRSVTRHCRLVGSRDLLVFADSAGVITVSVNNVSPAIFPEFGSQRRVNIYPTQNLQAPALTLARDGSWIIGGYWGSWLGYGTETNRLNITPFLGKNGGSAIAHSGKDGSLVVVGADDGDLGRMSDLKSFETIAPTSSDRSSRWRFPVLPGFKTIATFSDNTLPWWAMHIGRDHAWQKAADMNIDPQTVLIAQVDSGVNTSHHKFIDRLYENPREIAANDEDDDDNGFVDDMIGYDFVSDRADVKDRHGHGTHVGGLLASGQRAPFAVAYNARLMVVRALDQSGRSNSIELARAIDYAVSQGAEIINCSWGGGRQTMALRDAFRRAYDQGVLIFASAGNGGENTDKYPHVPSSLPEVLSVGAIDKNGRLASFSNYGPRSVDFLSPGKDIVSTLINGEMGTMSGTSMAAPIAASSAALLLGVAKTLNPNMSKAEYRKIVVAVLCQGTTQTAPAKSRCGTINVDNAMHLLIKELEKLSS